MSVFELRKSDAAAIIAMSVTAIALYFVNNAYVATAIAVILTFLFFAKRNYGACMATMILIGTCISVSALYVAYLAFVSVLLIIAKLKIKANEVIAIVATLGLMMISYLNGYESEWTILALAITALMLYVGIRKAGSASMNGYIVASFIAYGLVVLAVVMLQLLMKNRVLKFGRLAYEGSIRSLANACVIPLIFMISAFISGVRLFNHNRLWTILMVVAFSAGLLATISRGAIIAFLVTVLVAMLTSKRGLSKYVKLLLAALMIAGIFILLIDNPDLHLDRLFVDEEGGLNGRTNIWSYYWNRMVDGGWTHVLFGLGPGDLKRLGYDMYAHSTFLDIIFSYGLAGGAAMLVALIGIFKKVLKTRSAFLPAALAGVLTNYLTHGTVANFTLYIALAAIVGCSEVMLQNNANQSLQDEIKPLRMEVLSTKVDV